MYFYINNTAKGNTSLMLNKPLLAYTTTQGRMQDFSGGGGPNFKISGILDIHAAKLRAFGRGGFGGMPPQENF